MTKSKKYQDEYGNIEYRDQQGRLHNDHQSAVRCKSGVRVWYKHGKRHRTDGPAIKHPNGDYQWYENGKLHRTDGPAVKQRQAHYYDGAPDIIQYRWYQKGHLYKTETDWGDITYFRNGRLHRTDGPAVITRSRCEWWRNGVRHRIDGPAVEEAKSLWHDRRIEWWINGVQLNETLLNFYENGLITEEDFIKKGVDSTV
jgi:antitoxin component YwqK of YwqJK toxin-antitoxin module